MATPPKSEFIVWGEAGKRQLLHDGKPITPPPDWTFVPSGDAGLTRRLKAAAETYWVLVHRRRNRQEALGLWLPAQTVEEAKAKLEAERSTIAYKQKLEAGRRARAVKQHRYEGEFRSRVLEFLRFAECYQRYAEAFADAVTAHAVPVGSGTVARTERIPVEQRAEAAVIAWMRHQTTAYDQMFIARIKGERREVRRRLAERSRELLRRYRSGEAIDLESCPLATALRRDATHSTEKPESKNASAFQL